MRVHHPTIPSKRRNHHRASSLYRTAGVFERKVDRVFRGLNNGLQPGEAVVIKHFGGRFTTQKIKKPSLLAMQSDASEYHLRDSRDESRDVYLSAIFDLARSDKYVAMLVLQNTETTLNVHYFDDLDDVAKVLEPVSEKTEFDFSQPLITAENIESINAHAARIISDNAKRRNKELVRRIDGRLVRLSIDGEFIAVEDSDEP